MERRILVLDTTLRDGEQVPGARLTLQEKVEVAMHLRALNVDIIEAGFSASSRGDFEAVKAVAESVGRSGGPMITALGRAVQADIDAVYESIRGAERPLIHIVLGTSGVHVEKKIRRSREEVLQMGVDAVRYAKKLLPDIQYSTEDAARSEFEYLWHTIEEVVKAGATMINIPDTVGYAMPSEFGELIRRIHERLMNLDPRVVLSVHCHNDLGLATANTLEAVRSGATKVECTINGLGERAGNAALEEVVMALRLRPQYFGADTAINARELTAASKLVSGLTGLDVQVNKAVTGENAFAHSSGIHQDGLLKSRDVYEIIRPEDVGAESMEMVLTARSGRHAVKNALAKMRVEVADGDFENLFAGFLALADAKKEVYDNDLWILVQRQLSGGSAATHDFGQNLWKLNCMQVITNDSMPTATVELCRGAEAVRRSAVGDGPIDALYTAIRECTGMDVELIGYKINSISRGKEALGRVSIRVGYGGNKYSARAVDTDIIRASAIAYINGVNAILVGQ